MSTVRSWVLSVCLLTLFPAALAAQSTELPAKLTPMTELDWGDDPKRINQVITELGFHFREDASAETGHIYMGGNVLEHPASMVALIEDRELALVTVQLHRHQLGADPTRELLTTYRRVVELLSMRFGAPEVSVEAYEADSGLGAGLNDSSLDTVAAIEEGRAELIHAWQHHAMVIGVEINDGSSIDVTYERPEGYGTRTILERARSMRRW